VTAEGHLIDWGIRLSTPIFSLVLGNYGLPPSLARNAYLLFGGIFHYNVPSLSTFRLTTSGLTFGEALVRLRYFDGPLWVQGCLIEWDRITRNNESAKPSSFTHLARNKVGSETESLQIIVEDASELLVPEY
jgi:hypothetical protein